MDTTILSPAENLLKVLTYLFERRPLMEIRAIHPTKQETYPTVRRYLDSAGADSAVAQIQDLNAKGYQIYYTLNVIDPERKHATNTFTPGMSTGDADISRRLTFFIDIDAPSPSGQSATETESRHAHNLFEKLSARLREKFQFSDPQVVHSGNGRQMLYDIDLDASPETAQLLHTCLWAVKGMYPDHVAKVDCVVFNASRICKLPGTVAHKGEDTPERPHRLAKVLFTPHRRELVSLEQLEALAATATVRPQRDVQRSGKPKSDGSFDESCEWLETWMNEQGVAYKDYADTGRGRSYHLTLCPFKVARLGEFEPHHSFPHCYLNVERDGTIGAGCFKGQCSTWLVEQQENYASHWDLFRQIYDTEYAQKVSQEKTTTQILDTLQEQFLNGQGQTTNTNTLPERSDEEYEDLIVQIMCEIAERCEGIDVEDQGAVSQVRFGVLNTFKDKLGREELLKLLDDRIPIPGLSGLSGGMQTYTTRRRDSIQLLQDARGVVYKNAQDTVDILTQNGRDIHNPNFLNRYIDTVYEAHTRDYIEQVLKEGFGFATHVLREAADDFLNSGGRVSMSWDEMQNLPDEPFEWAVDGILPKQGTSMLVAPPKAGKTIFVRWTAYCLATGYPLLGKKVRQSRVVLYGCEENQIELKESLKRMERSYGKLPQGSLFLELGTPSSRTFLTDLKRHIQEGYDFIIIDPLIDALNVDNTNEYAAVNEAVKPLCKLAAEYKVHILCAHHAKRAGQGNDGFMGSQAFRAFTSCNLVIMGKDEEPRFLFSEKRHSELVGGSRFDGVHLLWNQENNSLSVGPQTSESKEKRKEDKKRLALVEAVEQIFLLLHKNPDIDYGCADLRGKVEGDNNLIDKARETGIKHGVFFEEKSGRKVALRLTPAYAAVPTLPDTLVDALTKEV